MLDGLELRPKLENGYQLSGDEVGSHTIIWVLQCQIWQWHPCLIDRKSDDLLTCHLLLHYMEYVQEEVPLYISLLRLEIPSNTLGYTMHEGSLLLEEIFHSYIV